MEEYKVKQCVDCKCYYLSPQPSEERLYKAYSDSYYGSGKRKFRGIFGCLFDFFQTYRVQRFRRYLKPNSNVIDIGCGSGVFAEALIRAGYNCSGIELPGAAARRAAKVSGLKLHIGEFLKINSIKEKFDAAIMWHVFEHVQDPKLVLNHTVQLVKPGGIIAIALPNIESLQSKFFKGSWFHLDPPRHLQFFSKDALETEMNKLGCTLLATHYWSTEYNPFGIQQSILNLFFKKRDCLYEVIKGNCNGGIKGIFTYALAIAYLAATAPFAIFFALLETGVKRGGCISLIFKL